MNPQIALATSAPEALAALGVDEDSSDMLHPGPRTLEAAEALRRSMVAGDIIQKTAGMTREQFAACLREAIGMIE